MAILLNFRVLTTDIDPDLSHLEGKLGENNQDTIIQSLQSSTRALIGSLRDRTKSLSKFSKDIKILLREGYDIDVARHAAENFFRKKTISFVAIDGTESQDEQLDMLLFYTGAFAYVGQLERKWNGNTSYIRG